MFWHRPGFEPGSPALELDALPTTPRIFTYKTAINKSSYHTINNSAYVHVVSAKSSSNFSFSCEMASIGRLLLVLILVQNASFHMVYSFLMAIHGHRNESIFSNSNLGAMIVYQFLRFLSLYSLHSNKFFFDKSENIRNVKKFLLWLLLSFTWRIGCEMKKQ